MGVAEDLDISAGKTTPFNRPQLGKWLKRPGDFDVIVFYRVDRIVRRLFDLSDLIKWTRDHRVTLVSATESHFDLSTEWGDVIALLVAKVAEMELAAISERNRSAAQHNLRVGKYRGGPAPWGYMPVHTDEGWKLVQDPEQVVVIHEVVERVLSGEPLRSVAHDLTERAVLTPRDRFAQLRGREVKGYTWHPGGLKRALTSPTLLGRIAVTDTSKGAEDRSEAALIVSDDGTPFTRCEPILSRDVFDRVGVELAGRENRKEPTKRSTSLLLGIIHCDVCGKPAYKLKGGEGRKPRYRCASAQYKNPCANRSIPLDLAEHHVEQNIMSAFGDMPRMVRVWSPGSDHSPELAEVNATLADLTDQLGTPAFRRGTPQRARLDARIEALTTRQAELSSKPTHPAGWTYEPTDDLVKDWWASASIEERNVWLRQMGFRVVWRSHSEGTRTVVDDFKMSGSVADLERFVEDSEWTVDVESLTAGRG
ncbi:phage Integrase [Mycobacteroides abscessus subsp. abscessus]|nr:phage Integrase [Mycobacteroides abscessus subsp. abscessus]SHZ89743.1 phage Integrase [Mycobacteroides abscessus subsp. abscessus]SKQ83238.1 phage Integrase [Mycobacteroides abscessus subsp. abscessus]